MTFLTPPPALCSTPTLHLVRCPHVFRQRPQFYFLLTASRSTLNVFLWIYTTNTGCGLNLPEVCQNVIVVHLYLNTGMVSKMWCLWFPKCFRMEHDESEKLQCTFCSVPMGIWMVHMITIICYKQTWAEKRNRRGDMFHFCILKCVSCCYATELSWEANASL